jgi:fibronectin type 3 domain-containing protein
MIRRVRRALLAAVVAAGCGTDGVARVGDPPAAPRALEVWYYARAVHLSWELGPGWSGEVFRVYAKRTADADYFLIAEVANCAGGLCSFSDVNVAPGFSYLYFVAAVDTRSGAETPTANALEVHVPQPVPPPVPAQVQVVALDDAAYVRWGANARSAADFSHYRVWLLHEGVHHLLGETDSEGFLDLLAQNGVTYTYAVTSVDDQGHESQPSQQASGTPRPDFHHEWLYDFFDLPASSGFRFRES